MHDYRTNLGKILTLAIALNVIALSGCGKNREMNETEFWRLIEISRNDTNDPWDQADRLTELLTRKPLEDIITFDRIFNKRMNDAYSWEMWAVAYIANGGASDDGFAYFRCWLIGQGREFYTNVLRTPESMDPVPGVLPGLYENEQLWHAAQYAYESRTGDEMPQPDIEPTGSWLPEGERWEEEDLPQLYPVLYKKFSEVDFGMPGAGF